MMAVVNEISKAFDSCAEKYEAAAKVQQEIGNRLMERLQYLKITPQRILDLGCGPGTFSRELKLMYPKAHIVGLDLVQGMLIQAKRKQSWRYKWSLVSSDMKSMPFANGLFDLVFANQVIHWGGSMPPLFREINRVMNINGCLMFTTLGPDTFKELKHAWNNNSYAHVNEFIDMHDIGDALMAEHFLEPVMDMEILSVHYETLAKLLAGLKAQGVKNINPQRNPGLTGRKEWQIFERNYADLRTPNDKYPLTYEVIYGHAWKGEQRKLAKGTETLIPVSQILKRS